MALPVIAAMRLMAGRSSAASFALRIFAHQLARWALQGDEKKEEIRRAAYRIVSDTIRSIKVTVDTRGVLAWLNDVQRRKIPIATAIALTRTAKQLQRILEREVEQVFDRPVPFTKRAFAVRPATRSNLQAEVFIKTRQAEYLRPQIVGGRRRPKRFEDRFRAETNSPGWFWVAGQGTRLNAAGNIPLATVKRIADKMKRAKRDVFFGKPGTPSSALPFGLWERTGKRGAAGIKPILIQIPAPNYRKRLDLRAIANRHVQRIFNQEFERAWREITR